MASSSQTKFRRAKLVRTAITAVVLLASAAAHASGNLTIPDTPLFAPTSVPGNLLLELSVEYPTALSIANNAAFDPINNTYLGYFDPNLCYTYQYDSTVSTANYYAEIGDDGDYFKAAARATGTHGVCNGMWSGQFLNWAAMQTIDPFRWALTGGYRSVDTPTVSILKKAWGSGDGGAGETPNRPIWQGYGNNSTLVSQYTPFTWANFWIRAWGLGTRIQFASDNTFDGTNQSTNDTPWSSASQNSTGTVYSLKVRVKACDNAFDSTYVLGPGGVTWCTPYGSNYKPEGLIQQYSRPTATGIPPTIRFGAIGYLNDSNIKRDAGVLRARMAFLGPTSPVPGNPNNTNPNTEWSATTGVYVTDPDPADSTATNNAHTCSNGTTTVNCVGFSGVTNYLNGFGEVSHTYKTYDPVSELYYAGVRYFKYWPGAGGGGNVASWSNNIPTDPVGAFKMIDQFPVITTWDNPVIYPCQKNYVLGIGDVNAHASGNIAGSGPGDQPQNNSNYEPTMPPEVTADTSVNSVTATNYIGNLEGIGNIGNKDVPWCCGDDDTYLMGGLAYDSHVNDMQPGHFTAADGWPSNVDANGQKIAIQTITTYWLDVEEYGQYHYQNQFWLAAKYGGFVLPKTYSEGQYTGSYTYNPYQTTIFPTTTWSNKTDASQPNGTGAAMPDNYYGAGNAAAMVNGLNAAFSSIAASNATTTTALAAASYNQVSTNFATYATQYDPGTWSSDLTAYTTTFDAQGNPTLNQIWDSRPILSGYTDNSNVFHPGQFSVTGSGPTQVKGWDTARFIATYNPVLGAGVPFRYSTTSPASISSAQATALETVPNTTISAGSSSPLPLLDYIRGDQSNELVPPLGIGFRARTYLQGDVVDSLLVPVSGPNLSYTDGNDPGYAAFTLANANRQTVIYVGANDGMLHAFSGATTGYFSGGTGGTELFAYIPSGTFSGPDGVATNDGLAALANPSFTHHFYVDSTPIVTDVDLGNVNRNQITNPPTTAGANWVTMLVGGLGKGGKSYYALNVTTPANMSNETTLASDVMWEFTDSTMGYSYGQGLVAKTKKYGWVVIFTSGLDAPGDTSPQQTYFYIVNPKTGALLEKKATPSGTASAGLAYSGALTDVTDGTIDSVYAGDLFGNIWRWDLTSTTGYYPAPQLFAQLTDSVGNQQPITSRPIIEVDPNTGNRFVLVGTGSLLTTADMTSTSQQSFYAIMDGTGTAFNPITAPITRSMLLNDDGPPNSSLPCGITVSPTGVTLTATNPGYYFDLSDAATATSPTCRVNISPLAGVGGTIEFAANLPQGNVCTPSGTNQTFILYSASGKSDQVDVNGNIIDTGAVLSGGLVTNLYQYNIQGTIRSGGTTAEGGPQGAPGQPPAPTKVLRLNWREVPSDQ